MSAGTLGVQGRARESTLNSKAVETSKAGC